MSFFADKRVAPFRVHASLTDTSTVTVLAGTPGQAIYLTAVIATNTGTSINTLVNIQFSGEPVGSVLRQLAYGGSGFRMNWAHGECRSADGASLTASLSAPGTVEIDVYGYLTQP